ncbi:hypothetical protein [Paenibacillus sp. FSL R7-0128]|uniref:hypothetical protein n=1 Tax=Paenibacillus sp. FSL R7-0128 TaxID=2954529 RepID=UPI0030F63202
MNRPLMGDSSYAVYYALKAGLSHGTGNFDQIIAALKCNNMGIKIIETNNNLQNLISCGFVTEYIGKNPHNGKENDTLYRIAE